MIAFLKPQLSHTTSGLLLDTRKQSVGCDFDTVKLEFLVYYNGL